MNHGTVISKGFVPPPATPDQLKFRSEKNDDEVLKPVDLKVTQNYAYYYKNPEKVSSADIPNNFSSSL